MISQELLGFLNLTWQGLVMLGIGGLLLYLGIARNVEPVLLLPIGIGILLTNIPLSGMLESGGLFGILKKAGIETELFPLLIFIGVGSMIDFGSLLARPYTVLLGAAAQFGIFGTFMLAYMIGDGWLHLIPLNLPQAASVGVIGSADGPTSIYVSSILAPELLAPIAVAAYSYMALVPIIQPPIMRLLTTREERLIRMPIVEKDISQRMKILFPIVVILVVGLIAPKATALIGCLMLGNLLKESGVVPGLSNTAENAMVNIVTILLGITVGGMMIADQFLKSQTIIVFTMGIVAFALDTGAGVIFGKIVCYLSGKKVNPLIGAAGISAFPMSARVVQKVGLEEDPENHLLMHAAGANTAGQIASVVAGGAILALLL
jgi:oxaloacetate decarboxylase beta subunit